jgi:type IV secretory pathway TrbD component
MYAQGGGGSPWENAVNVLQTSFTGPIAKGLALVSIVVGGLMFAFGEGGSKRMLRHRVWRWHGHWSGQLHGLAVPLISREAAPMESIPTFRPVFKSVNKPLTIWGVERRLFFVALIMGAATFTSFSSLVSGVVMFVALFLCAQRATKTDPQILRIVLNSSRFRNQYDPAKFTGYEVEWRQQRG